MLFHFTIVKIRGGLYFFSHFYCYVMTYKIFSEENLSQAGQKKQSVGIKSFYSVASYTVSNRKKLHEMSIKMFIKRQTKAGKSYAY